MTEKNGNILKGIAIGLPILGLCISMIFTVSLATRNESIARQNEYLRAERVIIKENSARITVNEKGFAVIQEQMKQINEKLDRLIK